MSSVNKVILIGHLGRDPEVRYLPSGDAVVNISIATSQKWTDKGGEKQEQTEWHRCVAFGKRGEVIGEYMKKGSQIYVEGRLQTKKWQDKDGNDRYTTEIVVDNFQFLGGGKGKPETGDAPDPEQKPATTTAAPKKDYATESGSSRKKAPASAGSGFDDLEDDIPF